MGHYGKAPAAFIEVEAKQIREAEKAYLIRLIQPGTDMDGVEFWCPKSQIQRIVTPVDQKANKRFFIAQWLMEKKIDEVFGTN